MKISFFEHIPESISKKMDEGLDEYNISHGINVNYQPFALVLFDERNEAIGVLDAFSSYSSIHIRDLWIDKAHRGKGHGRELISALENHFKGKGFHNINLITCEFQAPEFYKKCGFEVEFVRKNIENPPQRATTRSGECSCRWLESMLSISYTCQHGI